MSTLVRENGYAVPETSGYATLRGAEPHRPVTIGRPLADQPWGATA
jgi:hypothetical protein